MLATRAEPAVTAALVASGLPCRVHEAARLVVVKPTARDGVGLIVVVSAGTSDLPVAEEAAVTAEVMGNHVVCTLGAQWGQLDLNTMLPVVARNLLESVHLLARVSRVFADTTIWPPCPTAPWWRSSSRPSGPPSGRRASSRGPLH